MTLHHGLAALRVSSTRRATPGRPSLFEAGLNALQRSGILDMAIGTGQQAPDFELPGKDGAAIRLSSLLASGPVVVTFYRGGWCPYCNLQLRAYESMLPELTALGARLVAVSPQAPDPNSDVTAQHTMDFDVLSDAGNQVARRYGLVFQLPPSWRDAYAGKGIVLPEINGGADWDLPAPATFVVEPSGRITLSYVDVDYRNRLEPAEILAGVRSLHHSPASANNDGPTSCPPRKETNPARQARSAGRMRNMGVRR